MHNTGKESVCVTVFVYCVTVGCDFTNGFLCLSSIAIPHDDGATEKYVVIQVRVKIGWLGILWSFIVNFSTSYNYDYAV